MKVLQHTIWSAALLGLLAAPSAPARADEAARAAMANQILLAAGQRSLSQRMARSFCFADSGIAQAEGLDGLADARDDYWDAHMALAEGSSDLGIAALEEPAALTHWTEADVLWQELDALFVELAGAETVERRDFDQVVRLSARLLVANDALTETLRNTGPNEVEALDAGSAAMIDLYARQIMLAEKLARDTCLVARGDWGDGVRLELQDTLSKLEASLTAAEQGPPTAEIAEHLAMARQIWAPARETAMRAASDAALTTEELEEFAAAIELFGAEMTATARLLADHEAKDGS